MAEVIGVGSGILAIVTFTSASVLSAYQCMKSFKNCPDMVRELLSDLEILSEVLNSLRKIIYNDAAILSGVEAPLSSCDKACSDFRAMITKCISRSTGRMASVRDWAKLKLKEDDIVEFKNKLTRYKTTLGMALNGAILLTTTATAKDLENFKTDIIKTMVDLQNNIQNFERRRQQGEDATQCEWTQEEKQSAKECLDFCVRFCELIDEAQHKLLNDISAAQEVLPPKVAIYRNFTTKQVTVDQFEDIKASLMRHATKLQEIEDNLKPPNVNPDQLDMEACYNFYGKLRDQVQERINVFEDVSVGTGSRQVIASATTGDLIYAKRVTAAENSLQALGQLPASCLNQLSRTHHTITEEAIEHQNQDTTMETEAQGNKICRKFEGQYGAGRRLS